SLMVRKASGALSKGYFPSILTNSIVGFAATIGHVMAVDPLLEDGRGLEHHHAARRDRNLSSGLRVAADALAFLADHERAERGQFDCLALLKAVRNLFQHQFHECG